MNPAGLILALAIQAVSPAPFQTVTRAMTSQIDQPRHVVARTQAEWVALWGEHGVGEPPQVDFASRTVVAVFLGSRTSAGFSVEFVRAQEAGGVLTIQWREVRPAPGMISAQIMTSPMHAASVPRFAGEIRFEKLEK